MGAKRYSIFYILLCINLCSITILSAFNYFVFHDMNSKVYLESFIDYNKRVTNLAFRNIDKQIMESLVDIPQLYFSDLKLNEPVLLPQKRSIIDSPKAITDLVGKLEEIRKVYPYVVSMDIYYEGTGTIVTGFNKIHFPLDEKEVNQYLPWYFEFEKMGADQYFFELSDGVYPSREPVLTYVKKISGLKGRGQTIVAAFHISPGSFQEYIDESKGCFVLAAEDGRILYQSGSDKGRSQEVLDNLKGTSTWEEPGSGARSVKMKVSGEPVTVFSNAFTLTGLSYIYYIPDYAFLADYNVKSRIFLMNFGISILFNILVLAGISYLNYSVYHKRVLVVSKRAGISIGEDRRSFDSSLTVLTDTISGLNETVKSSEEVLQQNSLRSLILNRKSDQAYGTLFSGCPFSRVCCFIVYLKERDWESLPLTGVQSGYDSRSGCGSLFLTTMDKKEVVAVIVYDGDEEEKEEQIRAALSENFRQFVEMKGFVSGVPYELNQENLRKSYLSAKEAARYRFIYYDEPFLSWEKLKIPGRKSNGSHLKMFAAIEKDINNENILDFKYHMEALKVSFQTGNYGIDYCQSTLRDLVTLLYQTIQRHQLDMWVVYGYDIREYYKQLADIEAFCDWMNRLCEVLLTNIRQKKKPESEDLKARLEQMIEEQLEKDISLDYLSDCFSLRPDVLSRTFRQLMGKGYTEYIKEKKLNRALELISQDYSMKDIAYRLGYSSPQYFIKIFKETYGITPYQYKKRKDKKKEGESIL